MTTRNLTTGIDPATFTDEADQTREDQIGLDKNPRRDVQRRLNGLGFDSRRSLHCSKQNYLLSETSLVEDTYLESQQHVGFRSKEDSMKAILITAAMFSALALTPASAAMMSCTGDNMAKSGMMMSSMPDSPAKMGMTKEMSMANTDMSKGNMRGACMHYMKAQKMSMMK